jgi:hypothetical protein
VTTETGTQQPAGSDITEIRPFRVEISDAVIDDLRDGLARARWPEKEPVEDWSMGSRSRTCRNSPHIGRSPTTSGASPTC